MNTQIKEPLTVIKEMIDSKINSKVNCMPFLEYHKQNPSIWHKFEDMALKTIRKGFKNYSAKGIFEIIRWHSGGDLKSDGFKLNNNYTSDYARLFEKMYPQHIGFFRKRKLKKSSR